jgi:predicted amidophosphoribosyltransferase
MALIRCPECKNKVSETANSCPKCGWQITPEKVTKIKKTEAKEKALWLNIVIVAVALLWFFGSM